MVSHILNKVQSLQMNKASFNNKISVVKYAVCSLALLSHDVSAVELMSVHIGCGIICIALEEVDAL